MRVQIKDHVVINVCEGLRRGTGTIEIGEIVVDVLIEVVEHLL